MSPYAAPAGMLILSRLTQSRDVVERNLVETEVLTCHACSLHVYFVVVHLFLSLSWSQELRLVDCDWRQLLDMLPWEWACGPPGGEQGGVQHPQQVEHVEQQGQQAQAGTPASHPLGSHVGTETEPGGLQGIGQGPREAADGSGGPVGSAEAGRHDQGQPAGPQAGVLEEADAEAGAGAAATPAAATVAPEPMARPGAEAGACSVRAAQAGAACAGQGRGEGADHHSVPLCSGRACGAAAVAASPRTATGASGHTAVSAASAALRGCSSPGVCTPLPVGSCTYRSGRSTCCGEGLQGQQGAEERGGTADGGVLLNGAAHLEEERSDKSLSRQSSSSSSRSSSSSTCSPRRDERGKARKEEPWEQGQEGATGASCRGKRGAAGLEPGGPRGQDQHRADAGAGAAGNQEVAGGGEGSGAHSGAAGVGEEGGAAAAVGSNGTSIAASPTAMGPDTAQGPAAAGDGGRLGGGSKRECPLRLLQVGVSGPGSCRTRRQQGASWASRPSSAWPRGWCQTRSVRVQYSHWHPSLQLSQRARRKNEFRL